MYTTLCSWSLTTAADARATLHVLMGHFYARIYTQRRLTWSRRLLTSFFLSLTKPRLQCRAWRQLNVALPAHLFKSWLIQPPRFTNIKRQR